MEFEVNRQGGAAGGAAGLLQKVKRLPVGGKEIAYATETLRKYKDGKAALERRVIEEELWYQLRHDEVLRREAKKTMPDPTSAWLFDALNNKHADMMDNYPEPAILPRERSDEQTAGQLSSVVPVIIERNEFKATYSDNGWEKIKHGTGVYGVFWDSGKDNGLGEIAINAVDLLNIFWQPGITDIQKSRNVFTVALEDNDLLESRYPELRGKLGGDAVDVARYLYDENIDTSEKSAVVDWYYKVNYSEGVREGGLGHKVNYSEGKTVLHYCKFVNDTVLFASENLPEYAERGFYDHGLYPFVFDTLFPQKGTPVGFGYIAVTRDPQTYIDTLSGNILRHAHKLANPRYFAWTQCGINEQEFLDDSQQIVHVEGGSIDESRLRAIDVPAMPGVVVDILQMKVNELKETASNRDYNSGGTTAGVTAAAAIAALQEAGNKTSRDMISASYRAYSKIVELVVELMRQFYTEQRSFRVTAPNGYEFVQFSNSGMQDQPMPMMGALAVRKPIFDIAIKAQKQSPFSQLSQNETAKELYAMGFFAPEKATEALVALDMMEFEGKDRITQKVQEGQTLMNVLQQMSAQMDAMAAALGMAPSQGGAQGKAGAGRSGAQLPAGGKDPSQTAVDNAQTAKTPLMDRMAANARPSMG